MVEETSIDTVLNLRTTTSQRCAAVPRRAHIQGSWICVLLNSRLESNKEEEDEKTSTLRVHEFLTPSVCLGLAFRASRLGHTVQGLGFGAVLHTCEYDPCSSLPDLPTPCPF